MNEEHPILNDIQEETLGQIDTTLTSVDVNTEVTDILPSTDVKDILPMVEETQTN